MKKAFAVISLFLVLKFNGQITQLNSGTTATLSYLSAINGNILIGGSATYLSKSYDQCNNLSPLSCPGNSVNSNIYQRLDTNNIFMVSNGNGATLFRSFDGGNNWINKWYSSFGSGCYSFFDTLQGIVASGYGNVLYSTLNGGNTWTTSTLPISSVDVVSFMKKLNDSAAVFSTYGDFYISYNRAQSWNYGYSFGQAQAIDFCIINKDSIFGISGPSQLMGNSIFTKTFNRTTWQNSPAPLYYNNMICFRKPNELYIVGADQANTGGIVAKSLDFGQTWTKFNTGVVCRLTNLTFLNDSVAILTGTGGTLLRWNYKRAVFTGIAEKENNKLSLTVSPNPFHSSIQVKKNDIPGIITLKVFDLLGQKLFESILADTESDLNLVDLQNGIYFLKFETENDQKIIKVIKE